MSAVAETPAAFLASGSPVQSVLREALIDGKVHHPDGRQLEVGANISMENSEALYRTVRTRRPELVIEIGMAYGVSTLTILAALQENGNGRLISIDPYIDWPTGHQVALHQVQRAGVAHLHEHHQECSHFALPRLLGEGVKPEMVYIDGCHLFEYAFTDFFYADKLVSVGNVVAFNDAGWRSVFKVIRFLLRQKEYRELDVGMRPSYRSGNALYSLIKRLEGRSSCDRYFEKVNNFDPAYSFYRSF